MLDSVVLNTEEFLAWIGGTATPVRRRLSTSAIKKELSSRFCAIVFPERASSADGEGVVVLVDERKTRDFFAFVSTYVLDYVPFSAFFRVITTDQFDLLDEATPRLDHLDATGRSKAFVGVPIAEAALYLQSRGSNNDGRSITLAAANATYSAAILQGLALGASSDISRIGHNWTLLRSLVGSDQLPLSPEKLANFWKIIRFAIYGGGSSDHFLGELAIIRPFRQVMETGRLGDSQLAELLTAVPELDGKVSPFRGPHEDRARAVQDAITILCKPPYTDGQMRDCVAGGLLSLLGDGSFKFLPAALSLTPALPMAALWFAAWSGLLKSNDVMTIFNCLGRRIARDLVSRADTYSIPIDDISIEELRTVDFDLDALPRTQSNSISVEIYPNVSSRQGLPRPVVSASRSGPGFQKDLRELRHLIIQSSAILDRMDGGASAEAESKRYRGSPKSTPGAKRR